MSRRRLAAPEAMRGGNRRAPLRLLQGRLTQRDRKVLSATVKYVLALVSKACRILTLALRLIQARGRRFDR